MGAPAPPPCRGALTRRPAAGMAVLSSVRAAIETQHGLRYPRLGGGPFLCTERAAGPRKIQPGLTCIPAHGTLPAPRPGSLRPRCSAGVWKPLVRAGERDTTWLLHWAWGREEAGDFTPPPLRLPLTVVIHSGKNLCPSFFSSPAVCQHFSGLAQTHLSQARPVPAKREMSAAVPSFKRRSRDQSRVRFPAEEAKDERQVEDTQGRPRRSPGE